MGQALILVTAVGSVGDVQVQSKLDRLQAHILWSTQAHTVLEQYAVQNKAWTYNGRKCDHKSKSILGYLYLYSLYFEPYHKFYPNT